MHREVLIHASPAIVWRLLTEATKWPSWYPGAADVEIAGTSQGTLEANSRFLWRSFQTPVEGDVHEFETDRRLGWFAKTAAAEKYQAYHAWLVIEEPYGCRLISEETQNGQAAVQRWKAREAATPNAPDLWTASLKSRAEAIAQDGPQPPSAASPR